MISDASYFRRQALFRRLAEVDWDFASQSSESSFSSVHWHPCRYPSQIPALTIGRLSKPGDVVLDPFVGSGTTMVESQRLSRASVGIDINPVSCLVARGKTIAKPLHVISQWLDEIVVSIRTYNNKGLISNIPSTVQAEKWYMPRTLAGLAGIWAAISEMENEKHILAQCCFSAVLLQACREDRHWGYVCDNTQPQSERSPDPVSLFLNAVEKMRQAYALRPTSRDGNYQSATVLQGDAGVKLREIEDASVDFMVTSPPYFGVADYVKAQRLTMEWLSYPIEPIRKVEIGARSKRHRVTARAAYLSELKTVFSEAYRVLKEGSTAVIVFGQSPKREDAERDFIEDLSDIGFLPSLTLNRTVSMSRRLMPSISKEKIIMVTK